MCHEKSLLRSEQKEVPQKRYVLGATQGKVVHELRCSFDE